MVERHAVGALEDFPLGGCRIVTVGPRSYGIFNLDGRLYALKNVCPHQLGPLCEGRIAGTLVAAEDGWNPRWAHEGEIVICPWHSAEFYVPTGRCLANPRWNVPTYRVEVEQQAVFLYPGERRRARRDD